MENLMAQPATPSRNTPRDVFLYLTVIVTLAMVAGSLGSILFDFVNIWLPDTLLYGNRCGSDNCAFGVRMAMAVLIVALPVLFFCWRFLQREMASNPDKLGSRTRRWLLYFTLFVAGISLIGDFISLIYNFLQGLMTLQFFIKSLIFAWISGTIFYYFLNELKGHNGVLKRFVGWFAVFVAAASIVVGFVATGLPQSARGQEADRQRAYALSNLQQQVVSYYQDKGSLPTMLDQLNDPLSGVKVQVDPVTGAPYEYATTGPLSFRLCAVFQTTLEEVSSPQLYGDISETWAHGAGRVCFDRTIDPDRYPLRSKQNFF